MHALTPPFSNKNSSRSLLTASAIYFCSALPGALLSLLHYMLVCSLQLFYFISQCLQRLCDLIYHLIQIIYYYAHFWHYFYFRFLHKNSVDESPAFPCVLELGNTL